MKDLYNTIARTRLSLLRKAFFEYGKFDGDNSPLINRAGIKDY